MRHVRVLTVLCVFPLACAKEPGAQSTSGQITTAGPSTDDAAGDGDGDEDPTTTADPTDGMGTDTDDPGTDTDDPTSGNDGCSDGGDAGNEPPDDDLYAYAEPRGIGGEALAQPLELEADPDHEDPPEPYGGSGFVPDDDLGGVSECDIFEQNCVDGEKCVPYASSGGTWDANKCVPITGDGMIGDACVYGGAVEATDDCDATSICWGVNAQGVGTCTAICEGTPVEPTCPEGSTCNISNMGSIAICEEECNPLTQECPQGEACFWSGNAFSCVYTTQDIPLGEPCGFINDCAGGSACVNAELVSGCNGVSCCAAFCDLDCGVGECSTPGTSCQPFFGPGSVPPGSEDIGVCLAD